MKLNYFKCCLLINSQAIKIEYYLTDEDDLSEILDILRGVTTKWYNIGTCLKLEASLLDEIERETPDHSKGLKVISNWLLKNYNVAKFGEPNWKRLVEAVAASSGGNNIALAMKIAAGHQGIYIILSLHTTLLAW